MKQLIFCFMIFAWAITARASTLAPEPALNPYANTDITDQVFETSLTEDQKIEKLIRFITNIKNAKFIRNGSEYSPLKATDYLEYKLKRDREKISSARDFIRVAGTKSNSSGKPLLIRYENGRTMQLSDLLMTELTQIEKGK